MTDPTWNAGAPPEFRPLGLFDWLLVVLRGGVLGVIVFGGLSILLSLRLIERPTFGPHRPWTPWITVYVCRLALWVLNLNIQHQGRPMAHPGIMTANHSSWLDIFVLNAAAPLYFVSKSEVASWPGIGWLARATGTVFVDRDKKKARVQAADFEARLANGHRLLLFPEGTSSDGQRVLPFKPTLFAALFSSVLEGQSVQPVSVSYHAAGDLDPRFYGWWGDMEFGPHLVQLLGTFARGRVDVVWHAPVPVSSAQDRKSLARSAEAAVRAGHPFGNVAG